MTIDYNEYSALPGINAKRPCGCLYSDNTCQHSNPDFVFPEKLVLEAHLFKTIDSTLAERGDRYGDFADNARLSQQLKSICTTGASWRGMSETNREGLTMILQKIARICNGDPDYADNWHDIQGYAKLVEDRLPKRDVK